MDWKREAAEMLREYPASQESLNTLPKELERLELEATALHSSMGGGEPVIGGHGSADDRLISNLMKREAIKGNIELAQHSVEIVDRGLAVLDDEGRLILDLLYIHRGKDSLDRLCDELGIENEAGVYKRKNKVLRQFTLALYGVTET